MGDSLRDQLIQAGLVSEKQARLASPQPRPVQRSRRRPPEPSEQQRAAQRAQAQKAERDRELNQKLKLKAERAERRAQVRQLVEQYRLPAVETEDYFNFVDGSRIKRIAVDPNIRGQLDRAELRIARCDGRYALVPAAAAERISERDPAAVVALPGAGAGSDDGKSGDTPAGYEAYVIPDDLMW
jgi:uncharacterized protein